MRILCLTSSYPRDERDVAGRFVQEHCEVLRSYGHQVDVLTWSSRDKGAPESDAHRVRYAPRQFERLFYGDGTPENVAREPWLLALVPSAMSAMLLETLRRARALKPDLIIGHWLFPCGLIARLCGRALGIPSLVIGHSGGVHLLDQLPAQLARKLASVVTDGPTTLPTTALRRKLERYGDVSRVQVVPMGFEPGFAPDLFGQRPTPQPDWLVMGRLVPIKGLELAIEAFSRAPIGPGIRLHVAGDGPLRASYERLRHRNVVFHGFVTGKEKQALLRACGFFLLTSKTTDKGRHEGLPVSFLEASYQGLIPLTTDIPGITPYLAEPDRQCFRDRTPELWARRIAAMANLASEERAALARATHDRVAPLAWPVLGERWDALVRACV
jgi:glycosyltransferase involved in cell wall biosynthesis